MQTSRVLEWKMETECGSDNDIITLCINLTFQFKESLYLI